MQDFSFRQSLLEARVEALEGQLDYALKEATRRGIALEVLLPPKDEGCDVAPVRDWERAP